MSFNDSNLSVCKLLTSTVCFSKIGFLAFIAMVINCTAGMERKSQKIEVVVAFG